MKKVKAGEPLRMPARTFNTFIDEAEPLTLPRRAGGNGAATANKSVAVYVEKVYEEGGFAGLGIGA